MKRRRFGRLSNVQRHESVARPRRSRCDKTPRRPRLATEPSPSNGADRRSPQPSPHGTPDGAWHVQRRDRMRMERGQSCPARNTAATRSSLRRIPLRASPRTPPSARDSVLDVSRRSIVLVGHSYGGMILTTATNNLRTSSVRLRGRVRTDVGESIASLSAAVPGSLITPAVLDFRHYPMPDGTEGTDVYVKADEFRRVFAADLPKKTTAVLASTQRPIEFTALGGASGAPAWASIPSWYLVATKDQVIPVDGQRLMAHRAHATTVEVKSAHLVTISRPDAVVSIIESASNSVT